MPKLRNKRPEAGLMDRAEELLNEIEEELDMSSISITTDMSDPVRGTNNVLKIKLSIRGEFNPDTDDSKKNLFASACKSCDWTVTSGNTAEYTVKTRISNKVSESQFSDTRLGRILARVYESSDTTKKWNVLGLYNAAAMVITNVIKENKLKDKYKLAHLVTDIYGDPDKERGQVVSELANGTESQVCIFDIKTPSKDGKTELKIGFESIPCTVVDGPNYKLEIDKSKVLEFLTYYLDK